MQAYAYPNGSAQGTLTTAEVHEALATMGCVHEFPFFLAVYRIAFEGEPATSLFALDAVAASAAPMRRSNI